MNRQNAKGWVRLGKECIVRRPESGGEAVDSFRVWAINPRWRFVLVLPRGAMGSFCRRLWPASGG
ncbi:MAG: hypothetical protein ACYTF1_06975 [Planctomycetota bacterium]